MFSIQALELMEPYFGGSDRSDFRISPINGDLAGLPPLLVEAGGKEMFREHPAMMARRARAAGVKVKERIWEGMPHVFQVFPFLPEAKRARRRACRFLSSHMSVPTTRSRDSVFDSQLTAVVPGGLPGPAAKSAGEAAGVGEA